VARETIVSQGYPLWLVVTEGDSVWHAPVIAWAIRDGHRPVPILAGGRLPQGYEWQIATTEEKALAMGLADVIKPVLHEPGGDDA
jgi:hypothetical protein